MPEYILKVPIEDAGARLDIFIVNYSNRNSLGLSRTAIQKLISAGQVFAQGKPISRPHYKIKAAEEIKLILTPKEDSVSKPEEIPLEVTYEDADLAVINKPSGLVVHPAPGNYEHTLVNALLNRFKELSNINPARPGIVHRLDKETSGLLVIAKNNPSHLKLAEDFARHSIERKYVAIVEGEVAFDEDLIEAPIGRHPLKRKNMSVSYDEDSRYAKTRYRTLKRARDFSLLELEPFTGRTHQLRVHLAFLGHPILGDEKYGKKSAFSRLALHAKSLGFTHPRTNKKLYFESPLPDEFQDFIEKNFPKKAIQASY